MQFSIIVPAYNAEEFLGECLDSAFSQSLGDFELVCIDDGSTDGTAALLAERAAAEPRLRVVRRENGGPSAARNAGIRAARGDYLVFLDADDLLAPYALARIACAIDAQACDAVVFGWSYFPEGAADRFVCEHARVRDAFYPRFAPGLIFDEMSNPYLRLAVRREALLESGVAFDEELRVGEDAAFLFALYPRIEGVQLVSDALYRYRIPREGSVMADYAGDAARLCVADLNAAITIFGDWKAAGLLPVYGAQLVKWFVRGQLYTILRQPPEVREPLVGAVKQLLRASFPLRDLLGFEMGEPYARLVRIVLSADDDGGLVVDERELARALMSWRLAEYGPADLAATALDKAQRKARALAARPPRAEGAPVRDGAPLVSVIVPVYNVERYLDQALSSVEAQTLADIEIICVNDGSTDGSPEILRRHAARDARIRVIDKPNGGYGSACNRGIAEARGEWVAILEPDDWIAPEMYERACAFASAFEAPVDIVKTPYWRVLAPDTDRERRVNCSYRGRIRPKAQPFKLGDAGTLHLIIHHPSIWSALYRRSFLEERGVRFREIPGAGWADNPFLVETLCQARAIAYLDEPFYHYREETPEKTADFARRSWRVSLDRWHDMLDVYERLGVADEGIRRAHIRRGFTYVGLIMEYHDLAAESDVREEVARVFARMDDALVFSEPNVSPGSKRLYAKLKGVPAPHVSPFPYAAEVAKGGVYNLVNTGPAVTFDTLRTFVGAHAKREGR